MVLWAGSILHDFLAPASFTKPELTSADLLRLASLVFAVRHGAIEIS